MESIHGLTSRSNPSLFFNVLIQKDATVRTRRKNPWLDGVNDGLEGKKEATAMRKQLASRLCAKWNRKYSQVCGFIRSRQAIPLLEPLASVSEGPEIQRDGARQPMISTGSPIRVSSYTANPVRTGWTPISFEFSWIFFLDLLLECFCFFLFF